MWVIPIGDLAILLVFGLFLLFLWSKPKQPAGGLTDAELRQVALLLQMDKKSPQRHGQREDVALAGQVAADAAPPGPVRMDSAASQSGAFSLLGAYQRRNFTLLPFFFLLMFGLTPLWLLLFAFLRSLRLELIQSSSKVVCPGLAWVVLLFPSFFLAIISAAIPLSLLDRLIMGNRYAEFARLEYERMGTARRKAATIFLALLIFIITPTVSLCLNSYSRIDDQGVTVNWWGVGQSEYPFESIDKIVVTSMFRTSKGELITGKGLHLFFKDGGSWSCMFGSMSFGPSCTNGDELLNFLSRKSGKPVTKAVFIEDVVGRDK